MVNVYDVYGKGEKGLEQIGPEYGKKAGRDDDGAVNYQLFVTVLFVHVITGARGALSTGRVRRDLFSRPRGGSAFYVFMRLFVIAVSPAGFLVLALAFFCFPAAIPREG